MIPRRSPRKRPRRPRTIKRRPSEMTPLLLIRAHSREAAGLDFDVRGWRRLRGLDGTLESMAGAKPLRSCNCTSNNTPLAISTPWLHYARIRCQPQTVARYDGEVSAPDRRPV